MSNELLQKLDKNEMRLVRWMCGSTLKKGRKIQSLGELLGLAIKMGRLIWFGHIERKDNGTPEKFPMELNQG